MVLNYTKLGIISKFMELTLGEAALLNSLSAKDAPMPPHLQTKIFHQKNYKKKKKFLLHSNRQLAENRHVMCVVEKAGFEPRTLGTGAERATNCATAPVKRITPTILLAE